MLSRVARWTWTGLLFPIWVLSLAACSSGGGDGTSGYQSIGTTDGAQVVGDAGCSAAREVAAALTAVDTSDQAGLSALPSSVTALRDVVPAELRSEVDSLGRAVATFVGVLQRFDFDVTQIETDAGATAELAALDTPEVRTAVADLQRWLDDSCV